MSDSWLADNRNRIVISAAKLSSRLNLVTALIMALWANCVTTGHKMQKILLWFEITNPLNHPMKTSRNSSKVDISSSYRNSTEMFCKSIFVQILVAVNPHKFSLSESSADMKKIAKFILINDLVKSSNRQSKTGPIEAYFWLSKQGNEMARNLMMWQMSPPTRNSAVKPATLEESNSWAKREVARKEKRHQPQHMITFQGSFLSLSPLSETAAKSSDFRMNK